MILDRLFAYREEEYPDSWAVKQYKNVAVAPERNASWGIYCDKYRLWQVRGQKIKDFKAAEALAFELYELCHWRQETIAA